MVGYVNEDMVAEFLGRKYKNIGPIFEMEFEKQLVKFFIYKNAYYVRLRGDKYCVLDNYFIYYTQSLEEDEIVKGVNHELSKKWRHYVQRQRRRMDKAECYACISADIYKRHFLSETALQRISAKRGKGTNILPEDLNNIEF